LPKETTVAGCYSQALNLGPFDYQADALTACYCLLKSIRRARAMARRLMKRFCKSSSCLLQ